MITIVIFILCAIYGVFSSPLNLEVFERQSPPIESGGLIFETSNTPGVNCINGPGGEFSVTWENPSSLFICGKGWNPGSARSITYSGTINATGNAYVGVYGWTINPLVEYYIIELFDGYNPGSGMVEIGTVTSDGSTYNVYRTQEINQPSIEGTATFNEYWSIRQSRRTGGTVTTSNHFNAWAALGLSLGTFNYQIFEVEGDVGSGSAAFTVS